MAIVQTANGQFYNSATGAVASSYGGAGGASGGSYLTAGQQSNANPTGITTQSTVASPPKNSSLVNKGAVYESYDPNTKKTSYINPPKEYTDSINQGIEAQAVETPANLPAGAMVYQGNGIGYAPLSPETTFTKRIIDGKETIASDYSLNPSAYPHITPTLNNPSDTSNKNNPNQDNQNNNGASELMNQTPMTEFDAKAYAASKKEANYAQYIGGIGGKANPLYIGATNWATLQKSYTPYQLQQATLRTKDGIYWNPNVNIADIPAKDPATKINEDSKKIADILKDASSDADKTLKKDIKTDETKNEDTGTLADNEKSILKMLGDTSTSAEALYNQLYNTPEMTAAKKEVSDYTKKNQEYDSQIDALKDDIRNEVEGEASDSYITALAAVRGDKILKLKKANQIDLDYATSNLNNLKENAANLLTVKIKDSETRYNNLYQMLQLQIQQEGQAFNQETALANIQMNLPENRSITIGGITYKGLKENDNLNVIQFTDSAYNNYVVATDKKTGKIVYKQLIGKSAAPKGSTTSPVEALANYNATEELARIKKINEGIANGTIGLDYDADNKQEPFYYDKTSYDAAVEKQNNDWNPLNNNPKPIEFRL